VSGSFLVRITEKSEKSFVFDFAIDVPDAECARLKFTECADIPLSQSPASRTVKDLRNLLVDDDDGIGRGTLTLEDNTIIGGVIVLSNTKNVFYNCTFEQFLNAITETLSEDAKAMKEDGKHPWEVGKSWDREIK